MGSGPGRSTGQVWGHRHQDRPARRPLHRHALLVRLPAEHDQSAQHRNGSRHPGMAARRRHAGTARLPQPPTAASPRRPRADAARALRGHRFGTKRRRGGRVPARHLPGCGDPCLLPAIRVHAVGQLTVRQPHFRSRIGRRVLHRLTGVEKSPSGIPLEHELFGGGRRADRRVVPTGVRRRRRSSCSTSRRRSWTSPISTS